MHIFLVGKSEGERPKCNI